MTKMPSEVSKLDKKVEDFQSFNSTINSNFFTPKNPKLLYDTDQNFKKASSNSYAQSFNSQRAMKHIENFSSRGFTNSYYQNFDSIVEKPKKLSRRTLRQDSYVEKQEAVGKSEMLLQLNYNNDKDDQYQDNEITEAQRKRSMKIQQDHDNDVTQVPTYHLKENVPKTANFNFYHRAYLKIDCQGKQFPIHFFCNQDKINYFFYLNFIDKKPTQTKYQHFKEGSGKFDIYPPHHDENETLLDNNFDSKCKTIWILVEAPGMRSSNFSFNFTSLKYQANMKGSTKKPFSTEQIRRLFKIDDNFDGMMGDEIKKQVGEIREKRKVDEKEIVQKNKEIVTNYKEFRIKNTHGKVKADKSHLEEVIKRSKAQFKKNLERKIDFNSHHDRLKQKILEKKQFSEQKEKDYYFCYTWIVLAYFLQSTKLIKDFYHKKLEKAFSIKKQNRNAIIIQRCYRRKLHKQQKFIDAFDNRETKFNLSRKLRKDRTNCKTIFNIFCSMQKTNTIKKCINVAMQFTSMICEPCKIFNMMDIFVTSIKSIKQRWKNRITQKKLNIERFKGIWEREQFQVINWLTMHDDHVDDDNKLTFQQLYEAGNKLKKTQIPYILNRHLLYYTETRYCLLMKRQNNVIKKKAKITGKKMFKAISCNFETTLAKNKRKSTEESIDVITKFYENLMETQKKRPTVIDYNKESDPTNVQDILQENTSKKPNVDLKTSLVSKLAKSMASNKKIVNFDIKESSLEKSEIHENSSSQVNRKDALSPGVSAGIVKMCKFDVDEKEMNLTQVLEHREFQLKDLSERYGIPKDFQIQSNMNFSVSNLWDALDTPWNAEGHELWGNVAEILPEIYKKIQSLDIQDKKDSFINKPKIKRNKTRASKTDKNIVSGDLSVNNNIAKSQATFKMVTEEEPEQVNAVELGTNNMYSDINFENIYKVSENSEEKTVDYRIVDEKVYGEVKGMYYTINIKPIVMKCIIAAALQHEIKRNVFS